MTGIAPYGAQVQLNSLLGLVTPVVAGTAPATPIPGQFWINSSASYVVNEYNGAAWVAAGSRYLALCTADPSSAVFISDLQEVTTAGYSRIAATFDPATNAIPSVSTNNGLIVFGPFTANMTLASQWIALVTVGSGTVGHLLYTWTLDAPQQVNATQEIAIAADAITTNQS